MENYANIHQVWGQNNLDGNLNLIHLLNVETHTTETWWEVISTSFGSFKGLKHITRAESHDAITYNSSGLC